MPKFLLASFILLTSQLSLAGADNMPNFIRATNCCVMDGDENACMVKDLLPKFNVVDMKCSDSEEAACNQKTELEAQIKAAARAANCSKPL